MSTYETFESRLRDGEIIIMDGGTASEIRRRGVPLGELTWFCGTTHDEPGDRT
jgi:S-methylmethionine-dependent homocysteine/selenocysteine methylase